MNRSLKTPFRFNRLRSFLLIFVTLALSAGDVVAWDPVDVGIKRGIKPLVLNSTQLNESSGIAFSSVSPQCIWSHNDSGDGPRFIAFDRDGICCGWSFLSGVAAVDWEDMDAYDDDGPRLLVADVGDNNSVRENVTIYLFDEPDPNEKSKEGVKRFQTLTVQYSGGPANCESVAVDPQNRRILMLTKTPFLATMHSIPLPPRETANRGKLKFEYKSKVICTVTLPLATGMDFCPKTGDLWISNYLHAFRFPVNQSGSVKAALEAMPAMVEMPRLKQIEAIAVTEKGEVWVSSEGIPAKLQRLQIPGE